MKVDYPKGTIFHMQKGTGDYRVCAMCGTACYDGVKRHSGDAEWDAVCMNCAQVVVEAFDYPK